MDEQTNPHTCLNEQAGYGAGAPMGKGFPYTQVEHDTSVPSFASLPYRSSDESVHPQKPAQNYRRYDYSYDPTGTPHMREPQAFRDTFMPGEKTMPPRHTTEHPPLRRATARSADMPTPWAAGICSGLSIHLGISVKATRIIFIIASIIGGGAGALLYVWLWLMVPLDVPEISTHRGERIAERLASVGIDRRVSTARNQLVFAGIGLIGVAFLLILFMGNRSVSWQVASGIFLSVFGLLLIWSRVDSAQRLYAPLNIMVIIVGATLFSVGLLFFIFGHESLLHTLRVASVILISIVGVALALMPLVLRAHRDGQVTREQQVRDAERADIAAHLHDSVLQTLTLIRGAAQDPQRVRALALTQERELRSWLYTGRTEVADSFAQALKETVGHIESLHGVPVEVVTVGDVQPGPAELALIAACSEATHNAVRHGAAPISVYAETTPTRVDVYVKDAGPGFNLDEIAADRHGVKGSIFGRMERAGGQASIRRLNPGTEVHMYVPRGTESTN
ncbi:sensor histidine kinase [Schaalia sp. lx-260]|uniref:sensor histidine kinase n=1 Tax=Schaalia sp. lx-260 TaxID=2899082 RepID=UPI001E5C95F1|nr:PspC domain-containing protein [Schaalia sp. lx-260]